MRFYYLFILSLFISTNYAQVQEVSRIDSLIKNLKDAHDNKIMVVAHRGDWRNAPENSIPAIQNCIDMGIDMVEIDVHETKDGYLVLMHDKTINRTTNCSGKVSNMSLEELKQVFLKDNNGNLTSHRIPTLEEVLLLSKGKILINLDKSYHILDKCFDVMEKTQTVDHVIIKGEKTYLELEKEFGEYIDKVYFMPVVTLNKKIAKNMVDSYNGNYKPVAFEFNSPKRNFKLKEYFENVKSKNISIWMNSLWAFMNLNHHDRKARKNPQVYQWYIDMQVDIIQTDNPQLLINYLREKGLHD